MLLVVVLQIPQEDGQRRRPASNHWVNQSRVEVVGGVAQQVGQKQAVGGEQAGRLGEGAAGGVAWAFKRHFANFIHRTFRK